VAMLCAGNALLWWAKGPATSQGWATNADFFIAGILPPYCFLFLPLYTAVMMADPAIRDFRVGSFLSLHQWPQPLALQPCSLSFVELCRPRFEHESHRALPARLARDRRSLSHAGAAVF